MKKWVFSSLVCATYLATCSFALAKVVNLYEQPLANAKIVGTLDLSAGVVPIFTPTGGEWIKVGDPRNGNVGWMKANEMDASAVTVTQRITNGDGKNHIEVNQMLDFSQFPKVSPEQIQSLTNQLKNESQTIAPAAQQVIQQMVNEVNKFYQQQKPMLENIKAQQQKMQAPTVTKPVAQPVVPPSEKKP